ncbi:hypothetical protein GCM10009716_17550 [Streptomyces sodiiphilus]|uniref:Serine protease n=1 Tax=Streptomyces sodiiphilus TaxID=226217 RepID=A0ABN2P3G6_9ACTN
MSSPRGVIAAVAAAAFTAAALGSTAPPAAAAAFGIPDSAGDRWAARTVSTIGKIIWEEGGEVAGLCSGAVVDAPGGSVVATAAHCVSSPHVAVPPGDAWFVPAYDNGMGSYRKDGWKVASYHLPDGWDVNRHLHTILPHDYAFLTLETKGGRTVQQVHGANRLAFEPVDGGKRVAAFGYPAAPPYDGETLHYCAGRARLLTSPEVAEANAGGLLLERCAMTAGSSGGPWIQDYDPVTQSGTVVGVTSVGSGDGQVLGRPYPRGAADLLRRAAAG